MPWYYGAKNKWCFIDWFLRRNAYLLYAIRASVCVRARAGMQLDSKSLQWLLFDYHLVDAESSQCLLYRYCVFSMLTYTSRYGQKWQQYVNALLVTPKVNKSGRPIPADVIVCVCVCGRERASVPYTSITRHTTNGSFVQNQLENWIHLYAAFQESLYF